MKAWVLDGSHIAGVKVFATRVQAEKTAKVDLGWLWDTPYLAQCGGTDGVEVVRSLHRTAYLWGDGFIAQVRRAV